MKYRALLPLVTYPDANSDAVVANAIAVADQINASLHALAVNVDIPPVSNSLSSFLLDLPQKIREAETLSRDRGKHLLAEAVQQAGAVDVSLTTEEITAGLAFLNEAAAERARYFDLALVGWHAENPTSRAVAEMVIFGSGRPTILLPELYAVGPIRHVAIAWDGGRVAARAAADARPFLVRAERISVLTVVDEKPLRDKEGAERLAEGLRSVGLHAEAIPITAEDCPIGVTLQEHAIERGAGLLVMGGYGHSRVREFVLGGATEGVLSDLRLPTLLSH